MSETSDVLAAFAAAVEKGRPVVLATIVRARGSTPRGVGSRMAIEPGRTATGTIGGGCGEAAILDEARAAVADGRARLVRVDLTDDLYSWSPAVCGGRFDVLLEPWVPADPNR
ncbi:MAG TPA: XdhC family protein [Gemmatimonadota bacterium]|jgi:xanthine dehydrogenase accessory factor|nr:XdhC family protein [Gemmatimonadota bacterium]